MYYTILYNCKSSDRYVSDREDSQISEALNCLSTMMNIVREHKNPMSEKFRKPINHQVKISTIQI